MVLGVEGFKGLRFLGFRGHRRERDLSCRCFRYKRDPKRWLHLLDPFPAVGMPKTLNPKPHVSLYNNLLWNILNPKPYVNPKP